MGGEWGNARGRYGGIQFRRQADSFPRQADSDQKRRSQQMPGAIAQQPLCGEGCCWALASAGGVRRCALAPCEGASGGRQHFTLRGSHGAKCPYFKRECPFLLKPNGSASSLCPRRGGNAHHDVHVPPNQRKGPA
ncbi:hypothetical protein LSM04_004707 [Trypanosoma melophagium]|uniref:uncharacterized protein n=1 Tax=Trypanosoma melophagium TaxID=715481 RepID=UPI00351A295F|nr:hypothetical protein LSM04_004707 [Trypanosoma melophagium]